jgi:hypothetical protein
MEKITIDDLIRIAGKAYFPKVRDGYAVYDKKEDKIIATWDKPDKDDERFVLLYTIPSDIVRRLRVVNDVTIEFIDPNDKDEMVRFKNASVPDTMTYMILKVGLEPVKEKIINTVIEVEKENIRNNKNTLPDFLKDYIVMDTEEEKTSER